MAKSRNNKKKTSYTKGKRKAGLSAAVMAAETKIQKTIIDLTHSSYNQVMTGSGWYTPYNSFNSTQPPELAAIEGLLFNPNLYSTPSDSDTNMLNNIGTFIANGDERDQRNGRRITMLTSITNMVFYLRAKNTADPGETPVYAYSANPSIRVVQGWVKGGIDALKDIESDIVSIYSEIPFARYLVKYDKVISRRGLESGATDPISVTYMPFKFNFIFRPNRRITFDGTGSNSSNSNAENIKYDGWIPFIYILQPDTNLELVFENIKRVNIYKDL